MQKALDIYRAFGYNNTCRQANGKTKTKYADVAELADALDSGSSSLKRVWVQIPSSAPNGSPELRFGASVWSCGEEDLNRATAPQRRGKLSCGQFASLRENPFIRTKEKT